VKRKNARTPKRRNTETVADLCSAVDRIAPRWAAAEWDNTGLIAGDADWPARRVLLTIDLTAAVLDEARRGRFEAIVSYHPPIYKPTKTMTLGRWSQEGIVAEALGLRIAVFSPHTSLDAAPGGTNDVIAGLCGLVDARPFAVVEQPESIGQCKLVVFVPASSVEKVAEALFRAGCGCIGGYEKCSFRSAGQGTFFGTESTSPRVGRRGRLERVDEARLEVVCDEGNLPEAIRCLKAAHPYETPAFDVYRLRPLPWDGMGQGRVGSFPNPVRLKDLARTLQRRTRAASVAVVGDPLSRPRRAAICVGAAGDLPFTIPGFDLRGSVIITGEIRHHDARRYQRLGAAAIALGHWASERPVLKPLAARLAQELPGVDFVVSQADRDPFTPL